MTSPSQSYRQPEPNDDDHASYAETRKRMLWVLAAVFGILALIAVAFAMVSAANRGGRLYPTLPSPTPPDREIGTQVDMVSFTALNENPAAFLNRRIQVTGDYTPLELPSCTPYAGPHIAWSLVADSLQLNAAGFERVLRLAEPGLGLTVEGLWRVYSGPVGCGKEPPEGVVWYLAVTRIVEPNPLFGGPQPVLTFVPGDPTQVVPPTATPELAPTDEITDTVTLEPTATLDTTPGTGVTPLPTATPLPLTPLPTSDNGLTPEPTGEGTPPPDATPTGTIDPNATMTMTPSGTVTPGLPTNTPPPGGYPVPTTPPGGYP